MTKKRKNFCKICQGSDFYSFGLCRPCYLAAKKIREAENSPVYSTSERNRNNNIKRVRQLKMATPGWFGELDELIMIEAADLCVRREKATGIKWNSDHIVPVQNKIVCGLHIGCNIQVITAYENIVKRNLYWPDMPFDFALEFPSISDAN